jgi:UDP-glucose 4-epimerase
MRIVVTGASGSIGTSLLRLRDQSWQVSGISRREPDLTAAPYAGVHWVTCDVGARRAVRTLAATFAGADAVVHLAWAVQPSTADPDLRRTNASGTAAVLAAVALAEVPHLVCASSVAAYSPGPRLTSRRQTSPELRWCPPEPGGPELVTEDWARNGVPGSAYSLGKASLESSLDAFERDHPDVRVARIRPAAVIQPDAAAELSAWMLGPWVPRSLIGRRWTPVPLWRTLRLQLVHADDVAAAIALILRTGAAGAFNLAADPVLPARELAALLGGFRLPAPRSALAAAAWATWRTGLSPLHPGWLRLADRVALVDTTRARTELGWHPHHDTRAALAATVTAIRENRGVPASPALTPRPRRLRPGRPTHQSQSPPERRTSATRSAPHRSSK